MKDMTKMGSETLAIQVGDRPYQDEYEIRAMLMSVADELAPKISEECKKRQCDEFTMVCYVEFPNNEENKRERTLIDVKRVKLWN